MSLLAGLFSGAASLLPTIGGGLLRAGTSLLGGLGRKVIGGIGSAIGSLFGGGQKKKEGNSSGPPGGQSGNYGANQLGNFAQQGIDYGRQQLSNFAQQGINKLPVSSGMRDMLGGFAQQGIDYGANQLGNFAQQGIDRAGQWAGQQMDRFSQGFNQRFGGQNLPEGAAMVDQGGMGSRVMLNPNQMARRRIMQPQVIY